MKTSLMPQKNLHNLTDTTRQNPSTLDNGVV